MILLQPRLNTDPIIRPSFRYNVMRRQLQYYHLNTLWSSCHGDTFNAAFAPLYTRIGLRELVRISVRLYNMPKCVSVRPCVRVCMCNHTRAYIRTYFLSCCHVRLGCRNTIGRFSLRGHAMVESATDYSCGRWHTYSLFVHLQFGGEKTISRERITEVIVLFWECFV